MGRGKRPPAHSRELAVRNQFFTPRYVVQFLVDNTLGRIWREMHGETTRLVELCDYLVSSGVEQAQPRSRSDPRDLRILDPACGSGHFLLYSFDLLLTIYEEAYGDTELGTALQKDYPKLEDLRRDVPRLILARNLHGIDIDLRASQIAALALWLRCQRAYQEMGLKKDRPKITRSNFVCAEPMPGEHNVLKGFVRQLEPKLRVLPARLRK